MKKVILFGKGGQVGTELLRSMSHIGQIFAFDIDEIDFLDRDAIRKTVLTIQPDVIINAAAYTAVDKAETDRESAYKINGEAVKTLANVSRETFSLFVHYSTDYVFDGTKEGYSEDDEPNPLNVYGESKLFGDNSIIESGCEYFIFRTTWVYALHGHNFARTILKLARDRERLEIANDQFGVPTSAELIADVTSYCIAKGGKSGVYNLVPKGVTNWHEYAMFIIELSRKYGIETAAREIIPVPSSTYKTAAKRPSRSVLNTDKIRNEFGIVFPEWRVHAERFVKAMGEKL